MANYTRTNGANAQAHGWDDFEDEPLAERTGSWLPLEHLGREHYGEEALRPLPNNRRGSLGPADLPNEVQRTAQHRVQRAAQKAPSKAASAHDVTVRGVQAKALAMLAGAAIVALALYVTISAAVEWTQVRLDDFQYGRPRTSQVDAYVGHNETDGVPTHFIAMNLNRRVTVMELPGGDSTKAATIVGPYLFGEGEDLTPVQASAQDVNGDGKPDLVVTVKNEQLVYLNDGTTFKLITPEEHAALQRATPGTAANGGAPSLQEAGK